ELAQLTASEEVADHRAQRFRVDQFLRRHAVEIHIEQGHALFHQTLRAGKTHAALVGEKFTHCPDTPAAKVIDVIQNTVYTLEADEIFHRRHEIFLGHHAFGEIDIEAQFLVDFVTSDTTEIVFLGIKKQTLEQAAGVRNRWRIARAEF